jgi:hypothetical protein
MGRLSCNPIRHGGPVDTIRQTLAVPLSRGPRQCGRSPFSEFAAHSDVDPMENFTSKLIRFFRLLSIRNFDAEVR